MQKFPVWIFLAWALELSAAQFQTHLTHYGVWTRSDIVSFQRFQLVALQPGHFEPADGESQAIADLKAKGTVVLLYLSIGEDATTYDQGQPAPGDGRGPVHWNAATASIAYGNKGIASYYLDEWNAKGPPDSINRGPDGLPDRQGDWGSCLVNAGDSAWQALILKEAARLMRLGADGLFLDTPETANPWSGYGWTSEGMYHLIRRLRESQPASYLLLNRGLFFFDPDNALQYRWNPRRFLNGVLFESYYTGSNYTAEQGGDGQWRASPYFASNKAVSAPRLNAEMNRPDSRGTVFHIDYAAKPLTFHTDFPEVFQRIQNETQVEQGWVPQINDRLLAQVPTLFLDHPAPADRNPPAWRNTAQGQSENGNPAPPRVGALKAIPGRGQVTLRWDVASDQTWPVRYTVYYSKNAPLDFTTAPPLFDVETKVGADYTDRPGTGGEDGCPYEFTVTGLSNQSLYRFAVRAEDATQGITPMAGRIGPGGGIEDGNTRILFAIPRDSTAFPITVDGNVADWAGIPSIPDSTGDGSGGDLTQLAATDDPEWLYLHLQFATTANASQAVLLFNTDRRGTTGDLTPEASGFHGADYKWENGVVYRHQDWDWVRVTAANSFKVSGKNLELQIAKKSLGLDSVQGLDMLAKTTDGKEILPEVGLNGFSYTWLSAAPTALETGAKVHTSSRDLRLQALLHAIRLSFPNPEKQATILVQDVTGKKMGRFQAVTGEFFVIEKPLAKVIVISVLAHGQHPLSRIWMNP
jgi:hypothetical protein